MGSYTSPDISGYNSNPPSDDGTETTSNRIDWSTIKNKLNDPTKTYAEAIDSATTSAFSTIDGQIADGSAWYKADTGAADAYVVTLSPAVSSNVVGRKTSFKAANANTGASTLNINGIGAEAIKRQNGSALVVGDIAAGVIHTVVWDGTNYVLENSASRITFVNNSNGNPNISDTAFDVTAITLNTYETIGPTGSGATNIWAVLDVVPLSADWIEIASHASASIVGTTLKVAGYAIDGSGSETKANDNTVLMYLAEDGDSDGKSMATNSRAKVPVNSSGIFKYQPHHTVGGGFGVFELYLIGYGWN